MKPATSNLALRPVWSPMLRVLHWTLAGAMIASFVTHEGGGWVHDWTGFLALAAASLRVRPNPGLCRRRLASARAALSRAQPPWVAGW